MNSMLSLSHLRDKINNIDEKIIQLLFKRKELILSVSETKIKNHQDVRDIDREKKMLKNLITLGKKYHFSQEYIIQIFQLIIKESVLTQYKSLQKLYNHDKNNILKVGFLGPNGSYSHIAVRKYTDINYKKIIEKSFLTFQEIVNSVEKNEIDCAFLPIENSSSGAIDEVLYILEKTNLSIIGEINIHINHCLLAIDNAQFKNITTVYSHPQPLKQCSKFLSQFKHWKIKYTKSTADAIKKVIHYNSITNAALGSEIGGKIYKLSTLATQLTNQEKNITRFVLLTKHKIQISPHIPSKTTLIFSIKNNSEDLIKISSILQQENIIMRIISIQKNINNLKEELVYIDILLNISLLSMQKILNKIKKNSNFVKILGCYPNEKITSVVL
ncbi:chorismate mutase [Buchnera aphidicola]|uniref:chorismate mutase n=1 Tax=Buchnera aphidicola TaxID=9 RepID=UPI003BEF0CE8